MLVFGHPLMEGALKYTYLFLLSTTLFILPQFTQAQVAEPAPGGSEVAARSSVHVSIDWAKERLDEMDATLIAPIRPPRTHSSAQTAEDGVL